jgi:hypothetical protein
MGGPTIRDVARHARVSVTTAARALGGYGYVSAATRKRVQDAAAALDYHPNAIARSMIKGHTHTLAVVVSDNANPFFAAVVRGIEDTVLGHRYTVLLCNADEDPRKEATYLRMVREKRADGVILSPSGGPLTLVRSLLALGTPVVLVDRRVRGVRADTVLVDNRAAPPHRHHRRPPTHLHGPGTAGGIRRGAAGRRDPPRPPAHPGRELQGGQRVRAGRAPGPPSSPPHSGLHGQQPHDPGGAAAL